MRRSPEIESDAAAGAKYPWKWLFGPLETFLILPKKIVGSLYVGADFCIFRVTSLYE